MPRLYTIGHSTHSLQEFIAILDVYHISHLVDVRTVPKSRHVPWFNKEDFSVSLAKEAISYTHLSKLGGLRKGFPTSINTGWRNASFRNYADYMQTKLFYEGLKELHDLIKNNAAVAIMCAEAVPWRCHRSLIADAEIIRNIKVFDIISKSSIQPHKLTDFAVVNKQTRPFQIYYPKP
ncbi:Uncharacterized conserved protein [Legionella donaldsonii]|uniref:Uncharacterized conserved protein n=1 Tax=Legionella donaldsonii TaxID=45060 RepID=A0A378J2Q2_9GAMM|nr:DUF488 domain-containing protein [Legionella donaldsonii]STX41895.1 Uncharacterized conserved protein [Legionella donaldsonii]